MGDFGLLKEEGDSGSQPGLYYQGHGWMFVLDWPLCGTHVFIAADKHLFLIQIVVSALDSRAILLSVLVFYV